MTPLDPEDVRWIAWRNEQRSDKLTKKPYGRGGNPPKPTTKPHGSFCAEAENLARRLVYGLGGGIGYELGDIGNDLFIVGSILIRACVMARSSLGPRLLDLTDTCAEISASGTGIKLFHYLAADNVRWYLDLIGVPPSGSGCRRGIPGEDARDHGPAIEIYCKARFFAVTENCWPSAPNRLRVVDHADLERLARWIPPATSSGSGKTGRGDNSRSAAAFLLAMRMKGEGKSFDEWLEALKFEPECRDWYRDKGDPRQLFRSWERASGCAAQADVSGFSIFGTLGTDSRRYTFKNEGPIIDIGLRLSDIDELGLLHEPFATNKNSYAVAETLRRHGATQDEIDFLIQESEFRGFEGERVELNAMTSDAPAGAADLKRQAKRYDGAGGRKLAAAAGSGKLGSKIARVWLDPRAKPACEQSLRSGYDQR
jgi:hypothetical protein